MERPADSRPYGRRAFLGIVAAGIGALALGRPFERLTAHLSPVTSLLVSDGWRIYSVAPTMPEFDPATWRLEIGGLVRKPQRLDYETLTSLPRTDQVSTFHCVTGWSVENVHWAGVRLSDLIATAEPRPEAKALTFVSSEIPYVESLTLEQAMRSDVLLAYGMDGSPLSRPHGAPARVVIPEMYGYKSTKWLARIELTRAPIDGYWEQNGYDRDAYVGHSNGY